MAEDRSPRVEILLFGGPIVRVGEVEVRKFPTQYAATLLTLLALRPNHHFDRDELARLLWSDEEPSATRQRLRENLHQLRKLIPGGADLIQSSRQSIWLADGDAVFVDALEFDRVYAQLEETEDITRRRALAETALGHYTGPLAPALDGAEIQRIRDRYEALAAECRKVVETKPSWAMQRRRHAPALIALALLIAFLVFILPRARIRAQDPPPTPDQRVAILEGLRGKPGKERERTEQCVALGEEASKSWYGAEEARWVQRLRRVDPDLSTSAAWLILHEPDKAIQMCGALARYWYLTEQNALASNFLGRALDRGSRRLCIERARAIEGFAFSQLGDSFKFDHKKGLKYALQGLEMFQRFSDKKGLAHAYRFCGVFRNATGEQRRALQDYEVALRLFEESSDLSGRAYTLLDRGMVVRKWLGGQENIVAQASDEHEALRLFRTIGNDRGTAEAFHELSGQVDITELNELSSPVLTTYEQDCREQLHWIEQRHEQNERAQVWKSLLRVARLMGDKPTMAEGLWQLASIHNIAHHAETAAVLCGAYAANIGLLKDPKVTPTDAQKWARRWFGPSSTWHTADRLVRHGASLTLDDAVKLGLR